MNFNLPDDELLKAGFTASDVSNLQKVLTSSVLENDIKLEKVYLKVFDFGKFIKELIASKDFRTKVLKAYEQEIPNFMDVLYNSLTFDAYSLHFKFNLFILILFSLEKTGKVDELYLPLLSLEGQYEKNYITLLDAFFEMIRINKFSVTEIYDLFQTSNTLERTGWIKSNVPTNHKETIAEHMYNMYLMGLLYLPEKYCDAAYNKTKILKMVLIHDLAETLTGDIPNPSKKQKDEVIEDLKAKAIICTLLYNEAPGARLLYDSWEEWVNCVNINAQIAHDLDVIQLNYQFFTYATMYPNTFSDDAIISWTRRKPKTKLGEDIYKKVILDNPKFTEKVNVIKKIDC